MKTKVAIVGTGYVANGVHIPDWKYIGADVVAVCDSNKEAAEQAAKKWGIKRVYTDFKTLLDNEKDVIIDLCTPPSTHASLSIEAMNKGFSVLMEKPMSTNPEDGKKILDVYNKNKDKVNLCVVRNILFSPSISKIRSALEGKRDDILGVDIRMLHTINEPMIADKNHWCHSLPGGRFGECLIHPVYLLCNLLGEYDLKIENIQASKRGPHEWVKYDELLVNFTANGKFGSIYISFNSPVTTWPPDVRVYTKDSVLTTGNIEKTSKKELTERKIELSKKLERSALSGPVKELVKEKFYPRRERRGHVGLFREFAQSVREGRPMSITPEEAFKTEKLYLEVLKKMK